MNAFIRGPQDDNLGLIKFTMAKFYRVTGSSTQHLGVSPDVTYPSAFSADEFGESSKPTALPWDKIASAAFEPLDYVDQDLIKTLNAIHEDRMKSDQGLVDLQYDIDRAKEK